jgi:hypothetical protein
MFHEKLVRYLNKDTCPVAGIGFTTTGAAVLHTGQHVQSFLYNIMRLAAL